MKDSLPVSVEHNDIQHLVAEEQFEDFTSS
jgi:hypothetical protein